MALSQPKLAISLSYDDALESQLDNAIPALNKYQLKASFYVVPSAPAFQQRLLEWKQAAQQGHELGNHSLFHACRSSKPNRLWVPAHNDLDKRPLPAMIEEIKVANVLLQALDGKTERTLTPPCFDVMAKGGDYIAAVENLFVGVKSLEDASLVALIAPNGHSAADIIEFIEQQPETIVLVNVLMHGVGGDHLAISTEEHEKLLQYLVQNKDKYWTDTYLNIAKKITLRGSK